MPRRELLTPTERGQLFAFPEDEGELIRLATWHGPRLPTSGSTAVTTIA